MVYTVYVIIFFLGAVLASFAGVIIERGRGGFEFARLPEILGGRSYCPSCKATLTWWQLIPLVGWLVQKGKCFCCQSKIPARYLSVEMCVGTLFVLVASAIPDVHGALVVGGAIPWGLLAFRLLVIWAAIAIVWADLLYYELNVWFWLLLVLLGVVGMVIGVFTPRWMSLVWATVFLVVFLGLYQMGKYIVRIKYEQEGEGLGEGDVWMAPVIGLFFPLLTSGLDWVVGVQTFLLYLILSSALGLIFWAMRRVMTGDEDAALPFLPAMIGGFVVLLCVGEWVLMWL